MALPGRGHLRPARVFRALADRTKVAVTRILRIYSGAYHGGARSPGGAFQPGATAQYGIGGNTPAGPDAGRYQGPVHSAGGPSPATECANLRGSGNAEKARRQAGVSGQRRTPSRALEVARQGAAVC